MTMGRGFWRWAGFALWGMVALPLGMNAQTSAASSRIARRPPRLPADPDRCDATVAPIRLVGTVRDALTGSGVPGVQILVRNSAQREEESPMARMSTDISGSYSVSLARCPSYFVTAALDKWRFGPVEGGAPGVSYGVVVAAEGESPYRMDFRGEAAASLSIAFVTDTDREPLPALQVTPLRRTYLRGEPTLWPESHAQTTDAQGMVRFEMLRSGDYAFQVVAGSSPLSPSGAPPNPAGPNGEPQRQPYPFVYQIWPEGALDSSTYANLIPLAAASDLRLGAIVLPPQQLARLRFAAPGMEGNLVSILVSMGNQGQDVTVAQATIDSGAVTFPRFPVGHYRLNAYAKTNRHFLVAAEEFDVRAAETTVTPGLQNPRTIPVQFEFEGTKEEEAQQLAQSVRLTLLTVASPLFGAAENGSTSGAERVPTVTVSTQRTYRALIAGVPPGFVVTELRTPGGVGSPDQPVTFSGDALSPELRVVMARTAASLQARVSADVIRKCMPCSVYLMPVEPEGPFRYFAMRHEKVEGREGGSVTFSNLRPGSYWVWALPGPKVEPMQHPGALEQILSQATRITLEKNQAASVDAPHAVP